MVNPPTTQIVEQEAVLQEAMEFAVLTLAFIGRDQGTDRMDTTLDGLCDLAKKLDANCRAALQSSRPPVADELCVRLGELLAKATKDCALPWEVETEHDPDAEYGSGPDPDRGFDDFLVFDGKGKLLLSTATSDAKCIVEEPYGDEDGYRQAWDEIGKANVDLIVEAINALPTLLAERSSLQARVAEAEGALRNIANAVRLGAVSDVFAWESLANACQQTAANFLSGKGAGG